MASPKELPLDAPDLTEAWLRALAAKARTKKLTDEAGINQVTDLFLATAGTEAVRKVSIMLAPKEIETMTFKEISRDLMENLRPKKRLVVAERTFFMSTRQEQSETAHNFLQRLRKAARFCEFDQLGKMQSVEDDMIQVQMIAGLASKELRMKVLEQLQMSRDGLTLDAVVQLVQQYELIASFGEIGVKDGVVTEATDPHVVTRLRSLSLHVILIM